MSLPLDVADGPIDVGAVTGMMLFIGYLGTAAVPTLLGALRDITGDFDLVLLCFPLCAVLFMAFAASLSAERLRHGVRAA
jgi:cyanate permease